MFVRSFLSSHQHVTTSGMGSCQVTFHSSLVVQSNATREVIFIGQLVNSSQCVCVNLIPQHRDKLVSDWSDVKKLYGRYHELVDHYKISISQMAMEFFPIA